MRRFRFLRNPLSTQIGNNVEEFLNELGGPACLFLDGDDPDRTRAFVTLLHGNEPSGAIGLFHWLKSGRRPAVNMGCIVASVKAALTMPATTLGNAPSIPATTMRTDAFSMVSLWPNRR